MPDRALPAVSNKFYKVIIPIANHEKSFTKLSLCDNMTPGKKEYWIAYVKAIVNAYGYTIL